MNIHIPDAAIVPGATVAIACTVPDDFPAAAEDRPAGKENPTLRLPVGREFPGPEHIASADGVDRFPKGSAVIDLEAAQ